MSHKYLSISMSDRSELSIVQTSVSVAEAGSPPSVSPVAVAVLTTSPRFVVSLGHDVGAHEDHGLTGF